MAKDKKIKPKKKCCEKYKKKGKYCKRCPLALGGEVNFTTDGRQRSVARDGAIRSWFRRVTNMMSRTCVT